MEDLGTLKEQHREQKLFPQLLQFRRFFSTEKVAEQPVQLPRPAGGRPKGRAAASALTAQSLRTPQGRDGKQS